MAHIDRQYYRHATSLHNSSSQEEQTRSNFPASAGLRIRPSLNDLPIRPRSFPNSLNHQLLHLERSSARVTTDETICGNAPPRLCSCYFRMLESHCGATELAWEGTDGKQDQGQRRQRKPRATTRGAVEARAITSKSLSNPPARSLALSP